VCKPKTAERTCSRQLLCGALNVGVRSLLYRAADVLPRYNAITAPCCPHRNAGLWVRSQAAEQALPVALAACASRARRAPLAEVRQLDAARAAEQLHQEAVLDRVGPAGVGERHLQRGLQVRPQLVPLRHVVREHAAQLRLIALPPAGLRSPRG